MFDLTKGIEKPYEIKLEDGSILRLKKPTQALLMELAKTSDYLNAEATVEVIEKINELITKVFNNNLNGVKFQETEISEMLDLETSLLIIQDYLSFNYKKLGE